MKKVTIYTTPFCSYCRMIKQFFAKNNVKFEEFNVQADMARRQEMIEKSDQMGVPVVSIVDESGKEEIMIGFDQATLADLLNL
jgi:glutaredoxin-like YruB-family protein